MAAIRTLAVGFTATLAIVIVVWMFVEQDRIIKCSQALSSLTPITNVRDSSEESLKKISDTFSSIINRINADQKEDGDKWNYDWDKKADQTLNDPPPQQRTLILVRHGQYFYESGKLTSLGRQQANYTGLRLKELGFNYNTIIHSSMERAKETAAIIHEHLPSVNMLEDDLIREGGPVPPSPTITYWSLPEREYHLDGPRLETAFRKYFYRPDSSQQAPTTDILVAHGNIFRFFALRALQLEASAWMRVFIAHASISMIQCNHDGTVTMSRFGDSGHIPANMVTF